MMYAWYWFSLYIMFGLAFLSFVGFVWSPFGALIAYRTARGEEKHPVRYAFVAAISSVLFILPWISMIIPSRFRSLATFIVLVCAYPVWLIGPLGFLYIYLDTEVSPWPSRGLLTSIVWAMGLTCIGTLIWAIQSQVRYASQSGLAPTLRVIIPSIGLWVSAGVAVIVLFNGI